MKTIPKQNFLNAIDSIIGINSVLSPVAQELKDILLNDYVKGGNNIQDHDEVQFAVYFEDDPQDNSWVLEVDGQPLMECEFNVSKDPFWSLMVELDKHL